MSTRSYQKKVQQQHERLIDQRTKETDQALELLNLSQQSFSSLEELSYRAESSRDLLESLEDPLEDREVELLSSSGDFFVEYVAEKSAELETSFPSDMSLLTKREREEEEARQRIARMKNRKTKSKIKSVSKSFPSRTKSESAAGLKGSKSSLVTKGSENKTSPCKTKDGLQLKRSKSAEEGPMRTRMKNILKNAVETKTPDKKPTKQSTSKKAEEPQNETASGSRPAKKSQSKKPDDDDDDNSSSSSSSSSSSPSASSSSKSILIEARSSPTLEDFKVPPPASFKTGTPENDPKQTYLLESPNESEGAIKAAVPPANPTEKGTNNAPGPTVAQSKEWKEKMKATAKAVNAWQKHLQGIQKKISSHEAIIQGLKAEEKEAKASLLEVLRIAKELKRMAAS